MKAAKRRSYKHVAMTTDQALDIATDLGLAVRDYPVRIRPRGEGFEVIMPIEALARFLVERTVPE